MPVKKEEEEGETTANENDVETNTSPGKTEGKPRVT
jgi:hypothetical protein